MTIGLSENEFVLDPAQSREVQVGVYVGANAVPGLYEITVNVKAQKRRGGGVEVLGSAEQVASLSIVGEAGNVHVESVSPRGERVLTHIRLWKIIDGEQYEFAESVTGVSRRLSRRQLCREGFQHGGGTRLTGIRHRPRRQKSITLTVETIYFKISLRLARTSTPVSPVMLRLSTRLPTSTSRWPTPPLTWW